MALGPQLWHWLFWTYSLVPQGKHVRAKLGVATNAPPGAPVGDPDAVGTYAGRFGLGKQLAFGKSVRPFRRLLSAQAIYRREVFQ